MDCEEVWYEAFRVARKAGAGSDAQDVAQEVALAADKKERAGLDVTLSWVRQRAEGMTINRWLGRESRKRRQEEWHAAFHRPVEPWRYRHPGFLRLLGEVRACVLLLERLRQTVIQCLYLSGYSWRATRQLLRLCNRKINWLRAKGLEDLRRLCGMRPSKTARRQSATQAEDLATEGISDGKAQATV